MIPLQRPPMVKALRRMSFRAQGDLQTSQTTDLQLSKLQKKSPRPLKESNDPQQHHQILLMASGPILTSGRSLGAWRRLQCPSCVTPRTIPGRRKTNSRGRRKSACLLSERRRHHCVFIWLVGVVLRSVLHSSRCFWESGSLSLVRAYGLDNVLGGRRSYRLRST